MVEKFKFFLSKNWGWLVFLIMTFLSLSFMIFQKGVWTFIDEAYQIYYLLNSGVYWHHLFNFWDSWIFFGHDASQLLSSRMWPGIIENFLKLLFGLKFGNIAYFILYFLFSYLSSRKCLSYIVDKNSSIVGALFFTFNPLSIFMLAEGNFVFVYPSITIIIASFLGYINKKEKIDWKFLLVFLFGCCFLMAYPRISCMYIILLFSIIIFYWKFFWQILQEQKKKMFLLFVCTLIFLLPIILSYGLVFFDSTKGQLPGVYNYVENGKVYAQNAYSINKEESFDNAFFLDEIFPNFIYQMYDKQWVRFILISVFGSIFLLFFLFQKQNKFTRKERSLILFFLSVLVCSIFIRMIGKFVSLDNFTLVIYKYLFFLTNWVNWISFVTLFGLIVPFTFLIFKSENILKKILFFLFCLMLFVCVYSTLRFGDNPKLDTLSLGDIPKDYQSLFVQTKNYSPKPALFFPDYLNYFKWFPSYLLDITFSGNYQNLFSSNDRLVNNKQIGVVGKIYNVNTYKNIQNLFIFNLKDLFVFKDVKEVVVGQFSWTEPNKRVERSKEAYDFLINNNEVTSTFDNNLAHFNLINSDDFDYLVYLPKKIIYSELTEFLDSTSTPQARPVLVDKESYNKQAVEGLDDFNFNENNSVDVKYSFLNKSKYYLKINRSNLDKSMLLHLNQTFASGWKLKFVDKEYFEEKKCEDDYVFYKLSNNSVCHYNSKILELEDVRLLFKPTLSDTKHFQGNFIGNTWLVDPQDIPNNYKNNEDLYVVLVYQNQIYYGYATATSILVCIVLLGLTIIQEIKKKYFVKNENN
ncbi:MAG: hypothetical protein WA057_01045 [Candidatus Magasanikiibacteriota bacterium]